MATGNGKKLKKVLTILLLFVGIPFVLVGGILLFRERHFAFPAIAVAVLSCIPLFLMFERKESKAAELTTIAVLVALSALSRVLFAWLPGFKPVAALTIIVGIALGPTPGFVVGSLTAAVSNFYFGQGPWTAFQMFAWGLTGFLAGVFRKPFREHLWLTLLYGLVAGAIYSALMDVWTVLFADGAFRLERYFAVFVTSLPTLAEYSVSNVVFLLLLQKPVTEKLDRIRTKYGLFLETGKPEENGETDPQGDEIS